MNSFFSYKRVTRTLFWLVTLILSIFAFLILQFLNGQLQSLFIAFVSILQIYFIVLRLHDINRSGWNILWLFIPIIGWGLLVYYLLRIGQTGNNIYGQMIQR